MKKNNLVFISLIILLVGCSTSNNGTSTLKELKSNQFKGVIQELTYQAKTRSESNLKDIYFTTGDKNYFIKFSEGYITKDQALKHAGKEILIKGEIKNGKWEEVPPTSFKDMKSLKTSRSGEYIVLEKIYK